MADSAGELLRAWADQRAIDHHCHPLRRWPFRLSAVELRAAFTERVLNFDGKHYAYRDLEMFPKPRQNPFPIFVGGHNLNAVERAARWGSGWLPGGATMSLVEATRPGATCPVELM